MTFAELAAAALGAPGRRDGAPTLLVPRQLWLGALAAMAVVALLMAFQQVMRQAVLHGELRARSNALLSDATWRCNTLRGLSLRDACVAQLAAVPRDNARLQLLEVSAAASSALSGP